MNKKSIFLVLTTMLLGAPRASLKSKSDEYFSDLMRAAIYWVFPLQQDINVIYRTINENNTPYIESTKNEKMHVLDIMRKRTNEAEGPSTIASFLIYHSFKASRDIYENICKSETWEDFLNGLVKLSFVAKNNGSNFDKYFRHKHSDCYQMASLPFNPSQPQVFVRSNNKELDHEYGNIIDLVRDIARGS